MTLHTINKSPLASNCFNSCLHACSQSSAVLLIEDGVYAAVSGTASAELIEQQKGISFFALKADVNARGLQQRISQHVLIADDDKFVDLVANHSSVLSWY